MVPIGLGAFGGMSEADSANKEWRRWFTHNQTGISEAIDYSVRRAQHVLDNRAIQGAQQYLTKVFRQGGDPALSAQFSKNLQAAQQSRGLRRSPVSAQAEATGLTAFNAQLLASLIPQAESIATLGERTRIGALASEGPYQVSFYTGGAIPGITDLPARLGNKGPAASAIGGGIAGAVAAAQIGSSLAGMAGGFGGMGGGGFAMPAAGMSAGAALPPPYIASAPQPPTFMQNPTFTQITGGTSKMTASAASLGGDTAFNTGADYAYAPAPAPAMSSPVIPGYSPHGIGGTAYAAKQAFWADAYRLGRAYAA